MKVEVAPYSSVVGDTVYFYEDDGTFAGQIAFLCQNANLRKPSQQRAMCEFMAKALAQFFAEQKGGAA